MTFNTLKTAHYLQLIMLHFLLMALTHTSAVPHFKEMIVMATTCDTCGHKTNEVKSGGKLLNFACDDVYCCSNDVGYYDENVT